MYNSIKYLYPSAEAQVDFELRDDGQGAGVYIHRWDTAKLGVQPTPAKLAGAKAAADLKFAKAAQITTLYAAYGAAIQLPVTYMATTFQADAASQNVLTKCLVAGSVPAGFYWLGTTNAQIAMTFAQLQGLAGAMLAQGQAAFAKLQTKKAAVRDALTVAAVHAVVW